LIIITFVPLSIISSNRQKWIQNILLLHLLICLLLIANRKKNVNNQWNITRDYSDPMSIKQPIPWTMKIFYLYLFNNNWTQYRVVFWYLTFTFAEQNLLLFLFFCLFVLSDNIKNHRYRRHRLILLCSGIRIHLHYTSIHTSNTIELKEKRRRKSSSAFWHHHSPNTHHWFLTRQYNI